MTNMRSHLPELITFVSLVVALASVAHASVIRSSTIDNPCQADSTSTGSPTYQNIKNQMDSTITTVRAVYQKCQKLKQELVKQRITPADKTNLDSPLVNVSGVPVASNHPDMTKANNVSLFKEDYRSISIYILYLQHASSLVSGEGRKWVNMIDEVSNEFYSWLCKVDTILKRYNSPVDVFVNSTEITPISPTGSKDRFAHFYVLMKNTQDFITSRETKYSRFLATI